MSASLMLRQSVWSVQSNVTSDWRAHGPCCQRNKHTILWRKNVIIIITPSKNRITDVQSLAQQLMLASIAKWQLLFFNQMTIVGIFTSQANLSTPFTLNLRIKPRLLGRRIWSPTTFDWYVRACPGILFNHVGTISSLRTDILHFCYYELVGKRPIRCQCDTRSNFQHYGKHAWRPDWYTSSKDGFQHHWKGEDTSWYGRWHSRTYYWCWEINNVSR